MLDITLSVQANNNRFSIFDTRLYYDNDGIILQGVLPLKISNHTLSIPFSLLITDGVPMSKCLAWLGAAHTKNSGVGYPDRIDIVFDETSNIFDLIGEPSTTGFEASGRPCLICGGNPCECPSVRSGT